MEKAERQYADYSAGKIASKLPNRFLLKPRTDYLTCTVFLEPAEAEMVGAAELYES